MKVNIEETFKIGNISEAKVKEWLESNDWKVEKKDHELFPYDFDVTKGDKLKRIEVKTYGHKSYTTIFAETKQISAVCQRVSIPEYLTHKDEIDYIIWVDRFKNTARIFDNKMFADYVIKNQRFERTNSFGTATGVLVEQDSKEAGLKYICYL